MFAVYFTARDHTATNVTLSHIEVQNTIYELYQIKKSPCKHITSLPLSAQPNGTDVS